MVDVALQEGAVVSVAGGSRAPKCSIGLRLGDAAFRHLTRAAAIGVLLLLSGVIISLIDGSLPALRTFGFGFLTSERWNPVTEKFGALAPIYGTFVTSFIAMLIAVPVGLMIAFFLTELCPQWLRRPIGIAIELLAGIPSIIYGIWGLFIFAPFLQETLQPFLINTLGNVPVHRAAVRRAALRHRHADRGTDPRHHGAAVRDLDLARRVRSGARRCSRRRPTGVGCTTWEVVRYVVLPYARVGVIGGVMLGLGRALGETMAVTFVIGNAHRISASLLAPGTTISATIANEFTEAVGDLYTSVADRARADPVRHHLHRARDRALYADAHRAPDRVTPCRKRS